MQLASRVFESWVYLGDSNLDLPALPVGQSGGWLTNHVVVAGAV
jgi:hypothetical protein